MTKQEFADLAGKGLILLDGATGSNLIKAVMPRGTCTEKWVLEHPDVLIDLQKAYVQAGSQIVFAPTFGVNRFNMESFGLAGQLEPMIRRLVGFSQEAVGGKALIAGDISTTGQMLEPRGTMTYERLLEIYSEQITLLVEAGVDLLGAETLMSIDEAMAILDAAASVCDLPVMCSLTLEADGTALYGGSAVETMETLQEMGASAVGVNCSVGPDQLEAVIASMKSVAKVPVIAKPNAGLPNITPEGEAIYRMGSEEFVRYMKVLVDAGAGIIGGCCGTTPEFIEGLAAMKQSFL